MKCNKIALILTVVIMMNTELQDMTPCNMVGIYHVS
jgi:hypothetical protein